MSAGTGTWKNTNDIDKANVWLADQAEREGWTRVEQLQHHMVSLHGVKSEKNFNVMVEVTEVQVNCEADIVA